MAPGLYGVGRPDRDSPILVTGNYKLSFDALRFELDKVDVWILVVDTRGINVWCAAGKGTFSTEEIVLSINQTRIKEITNTRSLILPQFSATGVSGFRIKNECGFKVRFGPIQARDVRSYLENDCTANEAMRCVTFTLWERVVLIPVEIYLLLKPLAIICLATFLFSAFSFVDSSFTEVWLRGTYAFAATLLGVCCGSMVVPVFLPWLPGHQFWVKGLWPGVIGGIFIYMVLNPELIIYDRIALLLWVTAVSSFQAMNFTGCTPYTSPSGVEYEMRRGLPFQAILSVIGLVLWLVSPFLR